MLETQLSIFLENKPGVLAELGDMLGSHGINIRGISISDTVDHAVVRLIVDQPQKAIHLLGEHGALVVETEVLALQLPDQPGELGRLATKFAEGKINIEYAYGTCDGNQSMIFIRVSDNKKALKLLGSKKAAKSSASG